VTFLQSLCFSLLDWQNLQANSTQHASTPHNTTSLKCQSSLLGLASRQFQQTSRKLQSLSKLCLHQNRRTDWKERSVCMTYSQHEADDCMNALSVVKCKISHTVVDSKYGYNLKHLICNQIQKASSSPTLNFLQ
jgi:hypothetical protein